MEAGLVVKVSDEPDPIKDVMEFLEINYHLRRVSRILKNMRELGFHVYAYLSPRGNN